MRSAPATDGYVLRATREPRAALAALTRSQFCAIWIATALLFLASYPIAASSMSHSALISMLPFAAILAVAAIGQTLVVQQGGLDLSVAGGVSLSAALVTQVSEGRSDQIVSTLLVVFAVAIASGLIIGLAVTRFGITPLVASLGVNALLVGMVFEVTGGSASNQTPQDLTDFMGDKFLGVPHTVAVALLFAVIVSLLLRTTVWGRRFQLSGASARAARVAGIRVARYQVATYVLASLCYALCGVMLAGYSAAPSLNAGDAYLLPSVAAVVLGGTSLAGGRASVWATLVGALFLTQLDQLVIATGAQQAVQYLIQGAIVALGMGLRQVVWSSLLPTRDGQEHAPARAMSPSQPAGPPKEESPNEAPI